ncbi:MAG: ribonuclease III, partial [Proteobacteria bacterium]|nr:ribonuclease III [Pseudomonadota bacterium]
MDDRDEKALAMIKNRMGYTFRNPSLLVEALTHPSAVKEGKSPGPDNQRLEYLGDAVLQLVVSGLL